MEVRDLIDLLGASERAAWNGNAAELSALRDALARFGDTSIAEFCGMLQGVRIKAKPKKAAPPPKAKATKIDGGKIEAFVRIVKQAIENMASNEVSLESLRQLTTKLEGRAYNKDEVLEIAKQCGVSSAKTKGQAVERLRQKLIDLKTTLSKSRMYG